MGLRVQMAACHYRSQFIITSSTPCEDIAHIIYPDAAANFLTPADE
jgi:hypothetical protein